MSIQVRLEPGGEWHKRDGDGKTACGLAIFAHATREYSLIAPLCSVCHTRHERDTGQMEKLVREVEKESDPALYWSDPDDEPTDPDDAPPSIAPPDAEGH